MKRLARRWKAPTPRLYRIAGAVLGSLAASMGAAVTAYAGPAPVLLHVAGAVLSAAALACKFAADPDDTTPTPPAE